MPAWVYALLAVGGCSAVVGHLVCQILRGDHDLELFGKRR